MKPYLVLILLFFGLSFTAQKLPSVIAFGSCGHQDKPLEIFQTVLKHNPELFIFLGDNIYGDTERMSILRKKYRKLSKNKNFSRLRDSVPIIATWDDHDYGMDDAGKYYPMKEASKRIFLKFFKEAKSSERWKHMGIYNSYLFEDQGKRLQIILLDCRTFRNDLLPHNGTFKGDTSYHYHLDYSPYPMNSDSTLLGREQWDWLRMELLKPADVRIIGSSTQFATQYNGYEAWANFPREQKRMLNLIKETNANGVFFISGDVHYAELSRLSNPDAYPIYDLTCSGLTEEWKFAAPNTYRVGEPVMENHFGLIKIDWHSVSPNIQLEVWDKFDKKRLFQIVPISELKK